MITMVIYSWTILHFFWRLPGWLYFMSIGEVLTVYAYSMATNTRDDYPRREVRLLPAVLIGSVVGPKFPIGRLNTRRQRYDEYIANVDDEFGRILNIMEERQLLEKNYVVVTSDHGDLFERGVDEYITPLL
jgi:membrane-anchored protein YejM (alkaline phosphatase superfamily)